MGGVGERCIPGLGEQDGVLVRRGGFWEIAEDGQAMLQQLRAMVGEENVQSLDVTLL